jgi:ribosomal protein L11 methyltransferase
MTTQQVIISASPEQVDILLAELGEIHFDIFEDSDAGVVAYCQTDLFDLAIFSEVIKRYEVLGPISFQINEIEKQNWNAVWESNYDPIRISNQVFIRANFHESEPGYAMEIVINPKMSFGTGHHETTFLMTQALFEIELQGKSVLDAGTGTGILAILLAKLGEENEFSGFVLNETTAILAKSVTLTGIILAPLDCLSNLYFPK